jgi:hypothetical protein
MNYYLVIAFSFSIIFPVILGLIRFRIIDVEYRPFLICLFIGLTNEVLSFALSEYRIPNFININCYYLIEAVLFMTFFNNWGTLKQPYYTPLLLFVIISWSLETLLLSKMQNFNSYFLILYSLILAILSLMTLSKLISRERKNLLRNAEFIICVAFLIYYTITILSEVFRMYGLTVNRTFRLNIIYISLFTNLFANLLFTIAIAWMPTKRKFSLPSS